MGLTSLICPDVFICKGFYQAPLPGWPITGLFSTLSLVSAIVFWYLYPFEWMPFQMIGYVLLFRRGIMACVQAYHHSVGLQLPEIH